jgi:hypothetical protein
MECEEASFIYPIARLDPAAQSSAWSRAVSDVIEPASSGRASCRGCGANIDKDALRFGERVPNAFGEGEASLWFHVRCAAFRRPEKLAACLAEATIDLPDREELARLAQEGIAHHRLPRLTRLERSKSGRAKCRHCQQTIDKGVWRFVLEIWEEARFTPIGFAHVTCSTDYFGLKPLMPRLVGWQPELTEEERREVAALLGEG